MDEVEDLKDEHRMDERRKDKTFSQTRHGPGSDEMAEIADCPLPVKPVCLRNGLNISTQCTNTSPCGSNRLKMSKEEASPGLAKEIFMREKILREKLSQLKEKMWEKILEEDRKKRLSEQQRRERAGGNNKLR